MKVPEHFRIYCVVAETVQTALQAITLCPSDQVSLSTFRRTDETREVVQPAGRIAAQVGHVVSKVRCKMMRDTIVDADADRRAKGNKKKIWYDTDGVLLFQPITLIVKAARDSFELEHIHYLLDKAGIDTLAFLDTNPEYGPVKVKTAIATTPVDPWKIVGILDYLPLWGR